MTTRALRRPSVLFLAAALLVAAVELLVVRSAAFDARPGVLGGAVVVDVVILLPLLWAWLVVRPGRAPAVTVLPVAVAAWLAAKALLPAAGERWLHAVAELAPLLELAALAYLAVRGRRVARAYRESASPDPLLRLREAAGEVFGPGTASRLLADEIMMLRYLVRPPRPPVPAAATTFTAHRRNAWGAIVLALSMAVAVEAVAVHALVARWSVAGAWVLTALSLYSVLWLVADLRATRARPLLLDRDRLLVRTGLRWTADVARSSVVAAERPRPDEELSGEGELSTALPGPPDVVLELDPAVSVDGPFGLVRQVHRLGLAVDEPASLVSALTAGRAGS